ncbi:MAG: hypothetical protein QXQ39_07500 [Conexivisphaerales archaeon]
MCDDTLAYIKQLLLSSSGFSLPSSLLISDSGTDHLPAMLLSAFTLPEYIYLISPTS